MSPKKRSRFIAYIRVSTLEQVQEGVSLDAQRKKVEAYAALHELELVEIIADEGISAKSMDRPGLQRALEMLRGGEVDGLVVTKLDRLTRRTRDLLELVDDLCQDRGLALVSIAENVDTTTAAGRMVLTVLGALATWERETIGERTSEALQHLRAQGVRIGREGYGWQYGEDVDEDGHRTIERIPREERTIKRVKALRKRGLTLRAIAGKLEEEGHATKRGGSWHAKTVMDLLKRAS